MIWLAHVLLYYTELYKFIKTSEALDNAHYETNLQFSTFILSVFKMYIIAVL